MSTAKSNLLNDETRIYVADLAAYNAGYLHGIWLDASEDIDDIQTQVTDMLKQSPVHGAEEYAIHDYEGFAGCSVYEYEGLESVHEKAVFVQEHGELGAAVLAHVGDDYDEAIKTLTDGYCGEYESLADYAQELTESCGDVPAHLQSYIDYDRMGRDMDMSGDIYTITTAHNEVHIFNNL